MCYCAHKQKSKVGEAWDEVTAKLASFPGFFSFCSSFWTYSNKWKGKSLLSCVTARTNRRVNRGGPGNGATAKQPHSPII